MEELLLPLFTVITSHACMEANCIMYCCLLAIPYSNQSFIPGKLLATRGVWVIIG